MLIVGDNPIGDDGISLMVDHLHSNTTLIKLYLTSCRLSANGILYSVQCNVTIYEGGFGVFEVVNL